MILAFVLSIYILSVLVYWRARSSFGRELAAFAAGIPTGAMLTFVITVMN